MTSEKSTRSNPWGLLADFVSSQSTRDEQLSEVISLLADDDQMVRLSAAWACCLAVVRNEEMINHLCQRMGDQLSEEHLSVELALALEYLATLHPERIQELLDDSSSIGDVTVSGTGSVIRDPCFRREFGLEGDGRTETAEVDTGDAPDRAKGNVGDAPDRADVDRQTGASDARFEAVTDTESQRSEEKTQTGRSEEGSGPRTALGNADTAPGWFEDLLAVVDSSRFDEFDVLGASHRDSYADVYKVMVSEDGLQRATAFHLFDHTGYGNRFDDLLTAQIGEWETVGDHDHVVGVLDWGILQRPWLATDFHQEPLANRDPTPTPVGPALTSALSLVDAVSYIHQANVVHGGIDAASVVYPGVDLEDEKQLPLLSNVGLIRAYREHADHTQYLDPRYAAPEHYDESMGRIDHCTDIYQLGGVIYRLFTGRPPYRGSFEEIRESVLQGERPPVAVASTELSTEIDEIIGKAMATRKLHRYETVEYLGNALEEVGEEHGYL
jgi:hypothetical protein